jgi:hypothetical protein
MRATGYRPPSDFICPLVRIIRYTMLCWQTGAMFNCRLTSLRVDFSCTSAQYNLLRRFRDSVPSEVQTKLHCGLCSMHGVM